MYYLVLFLVAALAGGARCAGVNRHMKLLAEIDNHIDSNASTALPRRFVALTRRPAPRRAHHAGSVLALTCEAVAAPAPSVRWFKNDAPVYEYDKEAGEPVAARPSSVARVSSTLLVARADTPARYTCLVVAGANTARASTLVYSAGGARDTSERSRLVPLAPRVLLWYRVFVDALGGDVVLPCRARGHPRPAVRWTLEGGRDARDAPRVKVLRSGDLAVAALRWADVGLYTCTASNVFGSTNVTTFLYPALSDNDV